MISDLLTVAILLLMAFLVIYPAARALWQGWLRRQPGQDDAVPRR